MKTFTGRVAAVTGAASGIGLGIATLSGKLHGERQQSGLGIRIVAAQYFPLRTSQPIFRFGALSKFSLAGPADGGRLPQ